MLIFHRSQSITPTGTLTTSVVAGSGGTGGVGGTGFSGNPDGGDGGNGSAGEAGYVLNEAIVE